MINGFESEWGEVEFGNLQHVPHLPRYLQNKSFQADFLHVVPLKQSSYLGSSTKTEKVIAAVNAKLMTKTLLVS